jgi:hypothetical protein
MAKMKLEMKMAAIMALESYQSMAAAKAESVKWRRQPSAKWRIMESSNQ